VLNYRKAFNGSCLADTSSYCLCQITLSFTKDQKRKVGQSDITRGNQFRFILSASYIILHNYPAILTSASQLLVEVITLCASNVSPSKYPFLCRITPSYEGRLIRREDLQMAQKIRETPWHAIQVSEIKSTW